MNAWLERTDRMISAQLATYRRELGGVTRATDRAGTVSGKRSSALKCPRCGLVLAPRLPSLQPRHCPRCLAHRRAAVVLEPLASGNPSSTPDADSAGS